MDLQKFIALDVVNTNEWEELTRLSIVVEKILREDNKVERDLAVRAECQISNVYRVVIGDTKKALSTSSSSTFASFLSRGITS